jgi:hypothetical protein
LTREKKGKRKELKRRTEEEKKLSTTGKKRRWKAVRRKGNDVDYETTKRS